MLKEHFEYVRYSEINSVKQWNLPYDMAWERSGNHSLSQPPPVVWCTYRPLPSPSGGDSVMMAGAAFQVGHKGGEVLELHKRKSTHIK